jgi:hypothetical protein
MQIKYFKIQKKVILETIAVAAARIEETVFRGK